MFLSLLQQCDVAFTIQATRRRILDVVALKNTVEAADVANMALYLASLFGASITGQAISVDGGFAPL